MQIPTAETKKSQFCSKIYNHDGALSHKMTSESYIANLWLRMDPIVPMCSTDNRPQASIV